MRRVPFPGKIVIGIAAGASFVAFLMVTVLNSSQAVEDDGVDVVTALTPRQALEKGVVSDLIIGKIDPGIVSAKRGETLLIPVVIEHLGNVGTSKEVTITNFHNKFRNFAPSASEGLDDLEFSVLIQENDVIKGEIVMDEVKVLPSSVTILPNTSAVLMMSVTVPEDLPSEWTDGSITIGLGFDVLPGSPDVLPVTPSVILEVVE